VFNYACPTTVWLVKHIVVDETTILESDFANQRAWATEDITIGGISYRRVVNIKSVPARTAGSGNITAAQFTFMGLNPGATDSTFRRVAYRLPTEITSDRVQHECPTPNAEQILMQATMSLIDAINDHKKQLAVTNYIENTLKPRYWMETDIGEQATPAFCVKRPF
jgi:hypothetical protein